MPGSRIADIQHTLGSAENVTARAIIQGTQYRTAMNITRNDVAVDTTGWTMEASAEFYLAHVSESGSRDNLKISVAEFQPNPGKAAVSVPVAAIDISAGEWQLQIPADLYSDDIPINIEIDVPVAAICVTMTDGQNPAVVRRFRHLLIIRRGW